MRIEYEEPNETIAHTLHNIIDEKHWESMDPYQHVVQHKYRHRFHIKRDVIGSTQHLGAHSDSDESSNLFCNIPASQQQPSLTASFALQHYRMKIIQQFVNCVGRLGIPR